MTDTLGNVLNNKVHNKIVTVKNQLKHLLIDDANLEQFNQIAIDVNKTYTHVCQFIRLWILHLYDNNNFNIFDNSKFSVKILKNAFAILSARSEKGKSANNLVNTELTQFYNDHYKKCNIEIANGINYKNIFQDQSEEIFTNIETNIKTHFPKYVKQYIRIFLKKQIKEEIEELKLKITNSKIEYRVNLIFNDMFTQPLILKSNIRYHNWILEHRNIVLPPDPSKKSYHYDVKSRPQRYLKYMIMMSKIFRNERVMLYQIIPQRSSCIPMNFDIDTTTLILLFIPNKKYYLDNVTENQNYVWSQIFRIDKEIFKKKLFKRKKYHFGHRITTDGVSASIIYNDSEQLQKNLKKNVDRSIGRYIKSLSKSFDIAFNNDIEFIFCDPNDNTNLYHDDILQYQSTNQIIDKHVKEFVKEKYGNFNDIIVNDNLTVVINFNENDIKIINIKQEFKDYYLKCQKDKIKEERYKLHNIVVKDKSNSEKKSKKSSWMDNLIKQNKSNISAIKKLITNTNKSSNSLNTKNTTLSNKIVKKEQLLLINNENLSIEQNKSAISKIKKLIDKTVKFINDSKKKIEENKLDIEQNKNKIDQYNNNLNIEKDKLDENTKLRHVFEQDSEFPYLEYLSDEQIGQLKNRNLVYCDPGKLRLLTMYGKVTDKVECVNPKRRRTHKKLRKFKANKTKHKKWKKNLQNFMTDIFNRYVQGSLTDISQIKYEDCPQFYYFVISKIKNSGGLKKYVRMRQRAIKIRDKYKNKPPREKDNGYYAFSNKRKIFESRQYKFDHKREMLRRKKHEIILDGQTVKMNAINAEKILSQYSSKTCNFREYKRYLCIKNKLNNALLYKLYSDPVFRKLRWYAYCNKKRTYDNLVNDIGNKYGKDAILIYGDWSIPRQMRHFKPTPMIGLKRRLRQSFEIINIDEFRTSSLCYKTEEECGNLKVKTLKGEREIHSVLTYKMVKEENRLGCINRDKNAVRNMEKITLEWLSERKRPERYRRDTKIG